MKRIGKLALVCAAFIAGMAYVYSCGGGSGSELNAQDLVIIEGKIDALTLYVEAMDAKIDSLLLHADNADSSLATIQATTASNTTTLNGMVSTINAIKSTVDNIEAALP